MPIDMSRYLGLFTSEALEHLEGLSQELVHLEKSGGAERVDAMFRHAHSVKGMAASMGFESIARLAHRVEDLVDQVRRQPAVMSPDVADLLFAAADQLHGMVRAAGAGSPLPDASSLTAQISERLIALTGSAPAATRVMPQAAASEPAPARPLAEALRATARPGAELVGAAQPLGPGVAAPGEPAAVAEAAGVSAAVAPPPVEAPAAAAACEPPPGAAGRITVRVRIAPACPVPGVRAFLVHKKLCALGSVTELQPALEDLRAGRIPDGLVTIELATQAGADVIRKALAVVADLESVDVNASEPRAAPKPAEADAPRPASAAGAEPARTVRVKTELLDYFLDAVGELLLGTSHLRTLSRSIPDGHQRPVAEGVDRLHAIVKDLHNKVMSARMTPLSLITDRLPRAARDVARRSGREVDLVITGAEIELDRAILDELSDPMLHLLRNCVDHGIEDPGERTALGKGPRGRISIAARRDRDRVVLEIEDDGRGMNVRRLREVAVERGLVTHEAAAAMSDREACMLCCLPGISTASSVTELSGRGVGMDAVKRVVDSVGGTLEIDSAAGRGTRFTLRLPLTVAVVHVLLVGVGVEVYGLPIAKVRSVVEVDPATLARSRNAPLLPHDGALLPVHPLGALLEVDRLPPGGVRPHVVLDAESGRVALEVDRLLGQEEAVLKPLSRPLDLVPGLAGVTILGSGRPIFILDVPRLVAA